MKKINLLALFFLIIPLNIYSQELSERIENGDFELDWAEGYPSFWSTAQSVERETSNVHGGSVSLKQTGGTSALGQVIRADENCIYQVSFWYYIEQGDGTDARLWSYFQDENGDNLGEVLTGTTSYLPDVKGEWQMFSQQYTSPPSSTQLKFELRTYSNAVVYYDDIVVEKLETLANDQINPLRLNIYPNPSSDYIQVDFKDNPDNFRVKLIDLGGRTFYSKQIFNTNNLIIPISNLKNGIYFIQAEGNSKKGSKKIIKN